VVTANPEHPSFSARLNPRLIIRNFGSLIAGKGTTQAIGLLTNAYLARHVAAAGFGAVALAQSVMGYLSTFTDSGLSIVAMREGAQRPERLQELISEVTGLRLLLAAGLMPIGLLMAAILPFSESSRHILRIYSLTLPLQAIAVDWVFRALQRMHFLVVVQVLGSAATLLLTVALIHRQEDVRRVPVVAAVTALGAAGLSVYLLGKQGLRLNVSFSAAASWDHLKRSLPLCASFLALSLYQQANNFILGAVHGEGAVGIYSAAWRLTGSFNTVLALYYGAIGPAMMQAYAASPDGAEKLLRHSVRLTAIVAGGTALLAVCLGKTVVALVYGRGFAAAAPVFSIMLWSGALSVLFYNWGQLAIAAHRERLVLASVAAGGVVNLVVMALLVRRLGPVAAAIGNLAAEVAVATISIVPWPRRFGLAALRPALAPAALCAGCAGLALLVSRWGPVVSTLLVATTYVSGLILTGTVTLKDVRKITCSLMPKREPVYEQ